MKNIYQKYKIYGFNRFVEFSLKELYFKIWKRGVKNSYSQKGEDIIIDSLLKNKKKGFFVDVGAYDPNRFSNTKRFYNKGWKGINIEPDTVNYLNFKKYRERDINLNIGIGSKKDKLTFYRIIPDTLSTFSKSEMNHYKKQGYKLVEEITVEVIPLSRVFDKYVANKQIDFMSVDTEGYDLEVLKSNDWKKYKPKIICVEAFEHDRFSIEAKQNKPLDKYLRDIGYEYVTDNKLNAIYQRAE